MKNNFAILFAIVLIVSITLVSCSGNGAQGKLIIFDNYPVRKLLAISPVSTTGTVSKLAFDTTDSRFWSAVSPDGQTLAFVKAIGGPEDLPGSRNSEVSSYRLEIYETQSLTSPVILQIPDNIAYSLGGGIVFIEPMWIGKDIFLLVDRDGPPDAEQISKHIGLVKVNVLEKKFELVKVSPLANQAFYYNCFGCVLPDLSKVSLMEGNMEHFTIFDTGSQTLTDFPIIGMNDAYATWTPDGKGLVYMSETGPNQLCLIKVSVDGESIQSKMVFCPEFQTQTERMYHHTTDLHWSPDGKYLAVNISANFGSLTSIPEPYENYLYVLRMDSNPIKFYKVYSSPCGVVTWSPDSKQLAFVASYQEKTEIYTVNRDGTNLTMVYQNPAWVNDDLLTDPDFVGAAGIAGWLK